MARTIKRFGLHSLGSLPKYQNILTLLSQQGNNSAATNLKVPGTCERTNMDQWGCNLETTDVLPLYVLFTMMPFSAF